MAPRNVLDTCDWTATSAKVFGRYLRASARDITRREYPRPYGATIDTACRCYLRGPDGVNGLTPSGTWGNRNIAVGRGFFNGNSRRPAGGCQRSSWELRAFTEDDLLGAVSGAADGCGLFLLKTTGRGVERSSLERRAGKAVINAQSNLLKPAPCFSRYSLVALGRSAHCS